MTSEIYIESVEELPLAAQQVLEKCKNSKKFAFYGNMGAGKTTFIKQICKLLGSTDEATSPTYSLVNEYHTESGDPIFHFDLYRLESFEEALDIGIEDYLANNAYCFIEWPQVVEPLLSDFVRVEMEVVRRAMGEVRRLTVERLNDLRPTDGD